MKNIKNIVFEGGGVLGMAYAGAFSELDRQKIIPEIERVAGTSAGALFAMLVTLNYDAKTIKNVIDSTDFKTFRDHFNPIRVGTKYGLYKGDVLLEFIEKLIEDAVGDKSITFEHLKENGMRKLKVFACDLNKVGLQEFSAEITPKVQVGHAVRASMSIPLFFQAWKFPEGVLNDHLFVDGGTIYNFPIDAFSNLDETIGFFFETKKSDSNKKKQLDFDQPINYVKSLFDAVLKSQKIIFKHNKKEVESTVIIDTHGISPTEFDLTQEDKTLLFNSGLNATKKFLETHNKKAES